MLGYEQWTLPEAKADKQPRLSKRWPKGLSRQAPATDLETLKCEQQAALANQDPRGPEPQNFIVQCPPTPPYRPWVC